MKSKRFILFTVAASWYAIAQETNKHRHEIFFAENTMCKRICSKDLLHYGKSPPPPSSDLRPSPNASRHLEFLKKRARIDPPALLTGDRAPSLRWSCSPPSPRSRQRPAPKNARAFSVILYMFFSALAWYEIRQLREFHFPAGLQTVQTSAGIGGTFAFKMGKSLCYYIIVHKNIPKLMWTFIPQRILQNKVGEFHPEVRLVLLLLLLPKF